MIRKPTWDELLSRRRQLFVGRERERSALLRNFDGPLPEYLIFAFHGEDGLGKSCLVAEYQRMARERGVRTALVDRAQMPAAKAEAILLTMAHLASQLEEAGAPLSEFAKSFEEYQDCRSRIEADPEAPLELLAITAESSDRVAAGWGGHLTPVWVDYLTRTFKGEELSLVREPIATLSQLFARDLNQRAEESPILLCFDSYGYFGEHLGGWLRGLLERQRVSSGIWLVIAGRHPLGAAWKPFYPAMAVFELHAFSAATVRDYLRRRGIGLEARVLRILDLARGVPLLASALASADGNGEVLRSEDLAEQYLAWISNARQRQAVLYCAFVRQLDREVVAGLMGGDDAKNLFEWLVQQPFLRKWSGRWAFHPRMRWLLLSFARSRTPRGYRITHARLRRCHLSLISRHNGNDRGRVAHDGLREVYRGVPAWARHLMEALYHGLMQEAPAAEKEGLEVFLLALRGHYGLAASVVQTWNQAAAEIRLLERRGPERQAPDRVSLWADIVQRAWTAIESGEEPGAVARLCVALRQRGDLAQPALRVVGLLEGICATGAGSWTELRTEPGETSGSGSWDERAIRGRNRAYLQLREYVLALADREHAAEAGTDDLAALVGATVAPRRTEEKAEAVSTVAPILDHSAADRSDGTATEPTPRPGAQAQEAGLDGRRPPAGSPTAGATERTPAAIGADASGVASEGAIDAGVPSLAVPSDLLAYANQPVVMDPDETLAYFQGEATFDELQGEDQPAEPARRSAELLHRRGLARARSRDDAGAIELFTQAAAVDAQYVAAYRDRGLAHARSEEYARAIEDFEQVIALTPDEATAYVYRANVRYSLHQYELAVDDYEQALALEPGQSAASYNAACCHALLQHPKRACDLLERAIDQDPKYRERAQSDSDFSAIRDTDRFRLIVWGNDR